MSLKLYVAGPYSHRAELLDRANELIAASDGRIMITSSWLQGTHEAQEHTATIEQMAEWADTDIREIDRSDILIQFTEHPSTKGASHMEFMYAATKDFDDIDIIVCGPIDNLFHALFVHREGATHAPDWATARAWLLERAEDWG